MPGRRFISGFFEQFAFCTLQWRFSGIELAGGNLPQFGVDSVAVLTNEDERVRFPKCKNARCTWVKDELPDGMSPVREFDFVYAQFEQFAREYGFLSDRARLMQRCILPRLPGC